MLQSNTDDPVSSYGQVLASTPPKTPLTYSPLQGNGYATISLTKEEFDPALCIVIIRVKDSFGGLLNMSSKYPMEVNGTKFKSLEQLYQACRFPNVLALQKEIIEQHSPLWAKRIMEPRRPEGRPNWFQLKVNIMRWALRVKLAANYDTFGKLLDDTGTKTIVEVSPDGDFWGGLPVYKPKHVLKGCNVFGQLLMELRNDYRANPRDSMLVVQPMVINDFLLFGKPIGVVDYRPTLPIATLPIP